MSQYTGVVKWFNQSKGYGLLRRSGGNQDSVPFSLIRTDLHAPLSEGEPVSFDLVQRGEKIHAENVKRSTENLEAYRNLGGLYS